MAQPARGVNPHLAPTRITLQHNGRTYTVGAVVPRTLGNEIVRVFAKRARGSRHFLRAPRAIAFNLSTLRDAARAGATSVEVTDTETGRVYTTALATLLSYGFPVRRGFGEQVGLTFSYWSIDGQQPEAERRSEVAKRNTQATSTLQLSLFEGGVP